MFRRVRYLFVKELIQVLRDKRLRMTLILPPIFQLIIFGYAANLDVQHITTAFRDLDQTVDSRDLMARFSSSKYFDIVSYPHTFKEIKDLIQKGDVILSIEIPSGFSKKIKKGDTAADGIFSLHTINCPGCCGLAPVVTVGSEVHGKITQSGIPRLVKKYRTLSGKEA